MGGALAPNDITNMSSDVFSSERQNEKLSLKSLEVNTALPVCTNYVFLFAVI